MDKRIRIVCVEDLRTVREGLNILLAQYKNLEVITDDLDPSEIIQFVTRNKPEIMIIDLQLNLTRNPDGLNGFDICEKISKHDPRIKLIGHSMYDKIEQVNKFIAKGGHAFVSKRSGHEELMLAIQHVMENKRYVCREILAEAKNAERFMNGDDEQLKAISEIFTKTEKNVLEKIAKGFSTKQIAHQLTISEKTVETHRKHLFDKAGVKNVAELIAFVYSRRIVME